jgi:hypothetical protein
MTDPSEGRKPNTGQASDGGEAAAADFKTEAESSARVASEFRKNFLSRKPFLLNPCCDGFAVEVRPGMEKRIGSSERSWPHRNSTPGGNPTVSAYRHGQAGIGVSFEAICFARQAPRLKRDCQAAEFAARPRELSARIAF